MKRSKLVQQRPTLPFAWRPSQLRKYQDCMPARARNWLVERKDSALLISNSTIQSISYGFVGILSSLFCSNHLLGRHYRGRQTVENHLIHTGTNSYRIMTSFFRGLYFRGSRSVGKNRENLHPAKIPAIRYLLVLLSLIARSPSDILLIAVQ